MSWGLRIHPAVRKDLRRLSPEARNFILAEILPLIAVHPQRGEPLHGPLKGFWRYRAGEHRVAYSLDAKRREIIVLEIGPRGGFYERVRKRARR